MINSKTIAIIVGISIIVVIVSISIGIQSEEITTINSSTSIGTDVNDSAVVEKNTQNYIISVGDSPTLGDD